MPSFTLIGYAARSRLFDWKPLDSFDLTDHTIVLTGGSSGLGYAAAEEFAELGATLVIVARNPEKTAEAVEQLKSDHGNDRISFELADLSDLDEVRGSVGTHQGCTPDDRRAHPQCRCPVAGAA